MPKPIISLGVDGASRKSGFAILSGVDLIYHESYITGLRQGYSDRELGYELRLYYEHVISLVKTHKVEITVVEMAGGFRNAQTERMLAYFEAAAIMGASSKSKILRLRTSSARKKALDKGNLDKEEVVRKIRKMYGEHLTEDEAEAVVFALCGVKQLA